MSKAVDIENTNLAGIGSDEDRELREAAARIEFSWSDGTGSKPGIEIWRVENSRTDGGGPRFGIAAWPEAKYGQFHRGDSYIVLRTIKADNCDKLFNDVFFWIGSESSQDEYGVAAYKAVELDDLLKGEAVQHRETEGNESSAFVKCFPKGITYLEGGVDSGFRKVNVNDGHVLECNRLFRVVKKKGEKTVRCFQVPVSCSSLNQGDAFVLDTGKKIFTWFGSMVSPFEKSKAAQVAHNMRENRLGDCETFPDIDDENEDFWKLLGGRSEIGPAQDDAPVMKQAVKKMYLLSDANGSVKVKQIPLVRDNLVSNDVCLVDGGDCVYIWTGNGSNENEKQQALLISHRYLVAMGRHLTTSVTRVLEGQEARCPEFLSVF